jgi:hypothetical protein
VERYEAHIKRNQIKPSATEAWSRTRSARTIVCMCSTVFHRDSYRTVRGRYRFKNTVSPTPATAAHRPPGELRGSFVPRASSAPLCALWAAGPKTRSQNSTIAGHAELLTYKARWRGLAAHEERLAMSHQIGQIAAVLQPLAFSVNSYQPCLPQFRTYWPRIPR